MADRRRCGVPREFAIRERQRLLEEQERAILKPHRKQLGRQARLLIAEQARPERAPPFAPSLDTGHAAAIGA